MGEIKKFPEVGVFEGLGRVDLSMFTSNMEKLAQILKEERSKKGKVMLFETLRQRRFEKENPDK